MAKLSLFETNKIARAMKKARPEASRIKIGRKSFFVRHCGGDERAIKVKVYYKKIGGGERRGTDEYFCLRCGHQWIGLSDFDK